MAALLEPSVARYYLHLRDGAKYIKGPEGREFANLDAARKEAVTAAREILAELLKKGEPLDGQRIDICDTSGALLDTVPFKSVWKAP